MEPVKENERVRTVREAARSMRKFITGMMIAGPAAGVGCSGFYAWLLNHNGTWHNELHLHIVLFILYGLAVAFPVLSISCRLMIKMFFQNCEQIENQNFILETLRMAQEKAPHIIQNVETVMDKAVPIANNVEEVVARAKAMSSDIQEIAHKVRAATEAMNGTFSGEALKEAAEALKTIAAAFGGGKPGAAIPEMPAFEFDLTKGRKR